MQPNKTMLGQVCSQVCSLPHYRKDVESLERVQKRLPRLESISYKERLNKHELFSLEC